MCFMFVVNEDTSCGISDSAMHRCTLGA
jgi:hypothetical protein